MYFQIHLYLRNENFQIKQFSFKWFYKDANTMSCVLPLHKMAVWLFGSICLKTVPCVYIYHQIPVKGICKYLVQFQIRCSGQGQLDRVCLLAFLPYSILAYLIILPHLTLPPLPCTQNKGYYVMQHQRVTFTLQFMYVNGAPWSCAMLSTLTTGSSPSKNWLKYTANEIAAQESKFMMQILFS